jgi:NAD+ synthase
MNGERTSEFSKDILKIDPAIETERVCGFIRDMTGRKLRRKGVVVGLSGGIGSAVVAELCVKALGREGFRPFSP